MYLASLRLSGIGPFADVSFSFVDERGAARKVSVLQGTGGVGKTSVITALSSTRPGHCITQPPPPSWTVDETYRARPRFAVTQWLLSADDPMRPHPLVLCSPNAKVHADERHEALRRREQALFDREARARGFAFASIPGTRWFSRQPVHVVAPIRQQSSYEGRSAFALDDASRSDLTRETKSLLAYAELSAAVAERSPTGDPELSMLGAAARAVIGPLAGLLGYEYIGLDPTSFEPLFIGPKGRSLIFEALPVQLRHLVAFGAVSLRALWAAYPGTDPREVEGVIAIDDIDLYQDQSVQERLMPCLTQVLPAVQWIVTSSSPLLASTCEARDLIALRRSADDRLEVHTGAAARVH